MKRVQKLLGLCLIGSLLAVHPISSADFSVMHKISEKVQRNQKVAALAGALLLGMVAYTWSVSKEGSTLRAAQEYLLKRSELRERQVTSAVSLALAYAAHRYCKSKPVSAVATLLSLMPIYSLYKDISLVKDVQLAREGKEVPDDRVKGYMNSFCFDRVSTYGGCRQSIPGAMGIAFKKDNLLQILQRCLKSQEEFFKIYRQHEDCRNQLRRLARELLKEKGFIEREFKQCKESSRSDGEYHEQWIVRFAMLEKIINGNPSGTYIGYHSHFLGKNFMIKKYKGIVGDAGDAGDGKNIKGAK